MATVETMKLTVEPGENRGKSYQAGGFGVLFKIFGSETGEALAVVEHPIDPRRLVPPHTHADVDEYSYILEGEIGARIGDRVISASKGTSSASGSAPAGSDPKSPERACKPNSVSRLPGTAIIPLDPKSPSGSSSRPGDGPREAEWDGRPPTPYLALLRMGFTVPPPLPAERCALTAPFHPYRALREERRAVSFLWHFPSRRRDRVLPGMPPVRSSDFPPRSLGAITWPARSRGHSIGNRQSPLTTDN